MYGQRRTVMVIFGTRPEAIKLAPVVLALRADSRFKLVTCSTGQHRDMVKPVCDFFGVTIDYDLEIMVAGQTIDHVASSVLLKLPAVFAVEKPDIVIVQGDTTTALAGALSSYFHKIEIAHVEAGLRSHDLSSPWPEEGNRALVGRLATYHFAPTRAAYDNLMRENAGGTIAVTGNTVVDAALIAAERINGWQEMQLALHLSVSATDRKKILFTMHRRESFGEPVERVFRALRKIARSNNVEVIFPVHPNPNVAEPAHRLLGAEPNVRLLEPLSYPETIFMLKKADILISDSGGLAEEAPTFGTPALILRESTERPECVASGNAILVGYNTDRLEQLVSELLTGGPLHQRMSNAPSPFGDGKASRPGRYPSPTIRRCLAAPLNSLFKRNADARNSIMPAVRRLDRRARSAGRGNARGVQRDPLQWLLQCEQWLLGSLADRELRQLLSRLDRFPQRRRLRKSRAQCVVRVDRSFPSAKRPRSGSPDGRHVDV
jgi:UDP-N-acetylglucosamine 2-epimerase (non-hydrolysing)